MGRREKIGLAEEDSLGVPKVLLLLLFLLQSLFEGWLMVDPPYLRHVVVRSNNRSISFFFLHPSSLFLFLRSTSWWRSSLSSSSSLWPWRGIKDRSKLSPPPPLSLAPSLGNPSSSSSSFPSFSYIDSR